MDMIQRSSDQTTVPGHIAVQVRVRHPNLSLRMRMTPRLEDRDVEDVPHGLEQEFTIPLRANQQLVPNAARRNYESARGREDFRWYSQLLARICRAPGAYAPGEFTVGWGEIVFNVAVCSKREAG